MNIQTKINGYATTLYHAEHVPHSEAVKRFHAVLCMNPNSAYQLEAPGFDGCVRLFMNDTENRKIEILMKTDSLIVREFGPDLKRESFDRRVYEIAVAFLDNFDIMQFSHQSVSIQSRIEPMLGGRDPFFSWQKLFGAADRLPAILQRESSRGSLRLDFEPTQKNPQRISLNFRWNQRTPDVALVESTVQYPDMPISKLTLGRLSSALKDAELSVAKKIGRLVPQQPGGTPSNRDLVAA